MKSRYFSGLLVLATLASSSALAADEPKSKHWLEDAKGCKFLDPTPAMAAVPMRFSGNCVDGYVNGEGTVTVLWQPLVEYRGSFEKGILREGKVRRADGVGWWGDFKDNQLHGAGSMRFPSGDVVVGTFAYGDPIGVVDVTFAEGGSYHGQIDPESYWPQGRGRRQWPDGQAYEGEFLRGLRHGKGKATYPNGDVYIGEFAHDHLSGQGVFEGGDGYHYEGQWLNDAAHGDGTQKLVDGEVYVGEFRGGHRHGRGRAHRPEGTYDDGEWKNDKLNGKCEMKFFADGGETLYSGVCVNGVAHGLGRWEAPWGIYEGSFLASNLHGHGRVTAPGYTFEGEFVHNKKTGKGKEIYDGTNGHDKEEYEGDFLRGERHGRGILRAELPGGQRLTYDGAFNRGAIEGQGVMTTEGITLTGEFKEDVLYKGTAVDRNGRKFEIDLKQGTVLEVLPDGTKKPVTESELPKIIA